MSEGRDRNDQNPPPPPPKVTRHVQPLGMRVLVRIIKDPDRLESGLFLPEGAKENTRDALLGEVVEVARTMPKVKLSSRPGHRAEFEVDDEDEDEDEDEASDLGRNVSGVPLGAKVLFGKHRGLTVPWDDSLRVIDVRHLLAIVDEIPEDEIQ